MQELIKLVNRFLDAGWKELDTCTRLYDAVAALEGKMSQEQPETRTVDAIRKQLESIRRKIAEETEGINPHVYVAGRTLLPRVAWLPAPVVDEDSGIVSYPEQPSLPEGLSKEEMCMWKKAQADALMEEQKPKQKRSRKRKEA